MESRVSAAALAEGGQVTLTTHQPPVAKGLSWTLSTSRKGDRIYHQLKKLGSSLDWDRACFTMDPVCRQNLGAGQECPWVGFPLPGGQSIAEDSAISTQPRPSLRDTCCPGISRLTACPGASIDMLRKGTVPGVLCWV